jgi:hypothetical protein
MSNLPSAQGVAENFSKEENLKNIVASNAAVKLQENLAQRLYIKNMILKEGIIRTGKVESARIITITKKFKYKDILSVSNPEIF